MSALGSASLPRSGPPLRGPGCPPDCLPACAVASAASGLADAAGAAALSARLAAAAPGTRPTRSGFYASGAQAMEAALRIARSHSGRPAIIKLTGSCMPGSAPAWTEFGRPAGPVWRLRAPMPLHGDRDEQVLERLDQVLQGPLRADRVAALVIEPVQGEGAGMLLSDDFVAALRERCDRHHILLVADEVHCGLARSGRLFAMAHHAAQADLVVHAEGPDGLLPLAIVTGTAAVMQAAPDQRAFSAEGREPAVAALHAVLDEIDQRRLCQRAELLGRQLLAVLGRAMAWQPRIADIRGVGSMLAIECMHGSDADPAYARQVQERAMQRGLLLPVSGDWANVVRLPYALGIDDRAFAALLVTVELALRGG